jgi:hypothetical protein
LEVIMFARRALPAFYLAVATAGALGVAVARHRHNTFSLACFTVAYFTAAAQLLRVWLRGGR